MVEFCADNSMVTPLVDTKADIMAMANAFRAASDDDTRNVMTAMTNRSKAALESLKFFAVTKSWFVRAWPILTAKPNDPVYDVTGDNLREHIGKIRNSELVFVDTKSQNSFDEKYERLRLLHEIDSADSSIENNDVDNSPQYGLKGSKLSFTEYHRRISENPETTKMKPGLVHTRDYYFLGPSAWMLVKEKFGYDGYEISRCCEKIVTQTDQGRIAVALLPSEENVVPTASSSEGENINLLSTTVPLSGRFPYEKVISLNNNFSACENVIRQRNETNDETYCSDQRREKNSRSPPLLFSPSTEEFQRGNEEDFDPLFTSSENTAMEVEANECVDEDGDTAMCTTQVSRYKHLASGLSNLGNTCFMNSTLQCLAHTESLRKYFISGEYKEDLNRDNPLGTGGELATQFASLMDEMWVHGSNRGSIDGFKQCRKYSSPLPNAVYPRNFKNSLGKHAGQFMGYDQHDSQELATYLLDALHEDTNRVTKKPYVEKPEQGENESDAHAADTAWKMHLRREDSRILENFMGQMKSRLECCEEGCNRVSTTFDPFMYLSVPIPVETERTIQIVFVPLDPSKRMQNLVLTVAKISTVAVLLQKMNEELIKVGICDHSIPLEDLAPVEVYEKEIFKWHELEDHVDGIKNFDKTFVYELKSLEGVKCLCMEDKRVLTFPWDRGTSRKNPIELDLSSRTELEKGDRWRTELERFSKNRLLIYRILNVNRSTNKEKMEFYTELEEFLNDCYSKLEKDETSGLKRTRDCTTDDDWKSAQIHSSSLGSDGFTGGDEHRSMPFSNVKTKYDVAVLELCAKKLRQFITDLQCQEREKMNEGVVVQVGIKQSFGSAKNHGGRNGLLSTCLVLRLGRNSTVYSLREELAHRLCRSLIQSQESEDLAQQTKPRDFAQNVSENKSNLVSPRIEILRRSRLCYYENHRGSNGNCTALGMINGDENSKLVENGGRHLFATESDEEERVAITDRVMNRGRIYLYLEQDDDCKVFDKDEFDSIEVPEHCNDVLTKGPEFAISVLDCIKNYCKKEQLEDSEMWYCNKCKTHVRAWKQFHLYRTPPILIIHLKRFFFSATTHRRDKITKKIDFPLKGLDLRDVVANYEENQKPIYDCYAVSNHFGGLGGGHYTAYTLSNNGVWCNYDDSYVTTDINPKDVVSEAAYVLYYRRRDVLVEENRNIIMDTQISPMIYERAEIRKSVSETTSYCTAQAERMDLTHDDTESNSSSKSTLYPMESIDNKDQNALNRIDHFKEGRPLQ